MLTSHDEPRYITERPYIAMQSFSAGKVHHNLYISASSASPYPILSVALVHNKFRRWMDKIEILGS